MALSKCDIFSLFSFFYFYICVDFIQGACTEPLDSQVQGATSQPTHPWSLWLVNHFPHALLVVLWLWVPALIWPVYPTGKSLWLCTAFRHETLIKVTKSPLPTPLVFTQNKSTTHPRIGLGLGPVSWKFRELLGPEKLFCVCRIYIQDQSFNNFDNDTMKLSVNEAKLTGLWARNYAAI